ncbi:MAG: AMP nucleosidase [Chlamydiia bacterium]|nr:AMP nucleosidase [Chlamydiia bacterium]
MTRYEDLTSEEKAVLEQRIASDTLERYSGSPSKDFQPYVLLTNFPQYVNYFAQTRDIPISEGSMFKVAHSKKEGVSMLDFKIGSPAAALVIDLLALFPIKATCLLGMCGALRQHYKVGDYFVPVASIRGEGTSDFYFRKEVPAMANFVVQKMVSNVLEEDDATYHIGITHTTNKRFWEFNDMFKKRLKENRPQAIEMECATVFMAGYYLKLPVGALLLISDRPLEIDGIKTKTSSAELFAKTTADHVEKGVKVMHMTGDQLKKSDKGVYRGTRRRFEQTIDY